MFFPHISSEVKRLRLVLVLLALIGPFLFGAVETKKGSAAVLGCSQPAGQCAYLPVVSRIPVPSVRSESLALYRDMYLRSAAPDMGWSGGNVDTCTAGNISQAYRDAVRQRVNYYRQMAGVPWIVGFRGDYNQQAQAAALLMSANGLINHKPDASWYCYSEPARTGALNSNMIGGKNGPDAVTDYVRDEGDIFAGLRRYILYPQTFEMGSGDIPATDGHMAVNALRVIDDNYYGPRPATRSEYVAWPPPGYVPYPVVYALWSFSYAGADFSQSTVSLKENDAARSVFLYNPADGVGENTLVWRVGEWGPWPNPGDDTSYTVTVRSVLIDGKLRNFTYTVIVFDPGQ